MFPLTLSPEMQALLAAGIGFLITAGLKSLSQALGKDLTGMAAGVTGAVVTAVVFFSNSLLALVPESAQPAVVAGMALVVAVFGAFGIHGTIKSLRPVVKK